MREAALVPLVDELPTAAWTKPVLVGGHALHEREGRLAGAIGPSGSAVGSGPDHRPDPAQAMNNPRLLHASAVRGPRLGSSVGVTVQSRGSTADRTIRSDTVTWTAPVPRCARTVVISIDAVRRDVPVKV